MEVENQPPRADWPSWQWRESGWWLTVVGVMIAVILLVFPDITSLKIQVRIGLAILAVVGPFGLIVLLQALKALPVGLLRLRYYGRLYRRYDDLNEEKGFLRASIIDLWRQLENAQKVNIKKIFYLRETVHLLLGNKRGKKIEIGTTLRAIDVRDGFVMANLVIVEVRSDGYLAEARDMDPLWLGQLRLQNLPESAPPPRIVAFLLPKQDESDE